MKNSILKLIEDDINVPNIPFYKKKLFYIGIGSLLLTFENSFNFL